MTDDPGDPVSAPERVGWRAGDAAAGLTREWMVTNGLGGYASGTLVGIPSRRSHGLLVAALPAPLGRTLMLNHLLEEMRLADGRTRSLTSAPALSEFRLINGRPWWRYVEGDVVLEKSILMPYRQNTTFVSYRLAAASPPISLVLEPAFDIRAHQGRLAGGGHYTAIEVPHGIDVRPRDDRHPPVRITVHGAPRPSLTRAPRAIALAYDIERARGYDWEGELNSLGSFEVPLRPGEEVTFIVSTEPWDEIAALAPGEARTLDDQRRLQLIAQADPILRRGIGAELVLAADQFVITAHTRPREEIRRAAEGDDARTIIAGYPWFTDWGRDTMISLEGLTLLTGRHQAARDILHTFADHVRDGLIPNLFPEGENEGLYHTADATLWFFHALDRYERYTGDTETRWLLLPRLVDIMAKHIEGTRFGIGVDPADGLLREGAAGLQLTWMDAKVEDWVVTPRRGKPVEINALFYNALRLLAHWLREAEARGVAPSGPDGAARADAIAARADALYATFNDRFWYAEGGYLYDVVDAETGGNDTSFRPNQLLALSLPHPVLARDRWQPVLRATSDRLATPFGLRSLAPGHPDYKPRYDGDLRARDAAYHQGTVWGWLVGPFVDAWLRVYPEDCAGARRLIAGLDTELREACVGTISEIYDAEPPFTPRGCVAQAWSVAEALRAIRLTTPERGTDG
jgi:predicted glycogen debranching enzyme